MPIAKKRRAVPAPKPCAGGSARPTAIACAMGSVFATYEYSLGIVTKLSLRASAHTGAAIRRAAPAPKPCPGGSARPTAIACAMWSVFATHEYSLGIGGESPLTIRARVVCIRHPCIFARYRYMIQIPSPFLGRVSYFRMSLREVAHTGAAIRFPKAPPMGGAFYFPADCSRKSHSRAAENRSKAVCCACRIRAAVSGSRSASTAGSSSRRRHFTAILMP